MQIKGWRGAWQRAKARLHGAILQDCPPELAACQVCNRPLCANETWLNCERRLAAQRYLAAGDQKALERLRERQAAANCCQQASGGQPSP